MSEKIYFLNSKGDKLCGILSNPRTNKNGPIMILCHGIPSSKDNFTSTHLEKLLNEKNIATLRFDLFGNGESEGNFEEITISECIDDIMQAIRYIKGKGFSHIGLMGSSFSGMASTIIASQSDELFILVLKSPTSDYDEMERLKRGDDDMKLWKEEGKITWSYGEGVKILNYSFVEDYEKYNTYESAKNITIPTLIVHGDKDTNVPITQSEKLAKSISNCRLEIIHNAGHRFTNPEDAQRVISLIRDFIVEYI